MVYKNIWVLWVGLILIFISLVWFTGQTRCVDSWSYSVDEGYSINYVYKFLRCSEQDIINEELVRAKIRQDTNDFFALNYSGVFK